MNRSVAALATVGVLVGPALVAAPRPERPGDRAAGSTAEVVAACRASGLQGWELVDEATRLVNAGYAKHSLWHLWESPGASLERGRGWSGQYNRALADVLAELGFRVEVVHASRVRGLGRNPWWQAGHTWLRVTHDGRTRDVCASRPGNTAGQVPFVAMTQVRPVHRWTRAAVSTALAPVVAVQAWRQVAGAEVPRWLYRDFNDPL